MKRIKAIPHQVGEKGSHCGAKPAGGIHSILHIGNFLSSRGISRQFVEELADRMQSTGWSVFRTSFVLFRPARLLDMVKNILVHRNEYRVAHISIFSGRAFLWAMASAYTLRLIQRPFVISLHGGNLPDFARRWPTIVRWLMTSASAAVCPSNYLFKVFKPLRADLRLLPNPIEIRDYAFKHRQQPKPHLIWLRAFHRIYNPVLAPQALNLLKDEFPEITISMIGSDRRDGSLAETTAVATELRVLDRIRFVGKVPKDEVPGWLNTGDVFVNTTNIDNTPTSILEAMASGLCIVSTNVGGVPFLLDDGTDALLVPPGDPERMATAIRRILTEPGMAGRLSQNARNKVEKFDWSYVLPQWQELFIKCAEGT